MSIRSKASTVARRLGIDPNAVAAFAVLLLGAVLFLSVLRSSLFADVPEEKRLWFEVTFLLLSAVVAELLVVYLKQPTVIVLLLVGAMLSKSFLDIAWPMIFTALSTLGIGGLFSPSTLHLVSAEGAIRVFAQLGAIFLLFKVGMHSKVEEIFNPGNLFVALLGVVLPFAGGYYYAQLTGGSFAYSLFVGAALSATSVGVTVAVLMELGAMNKAYAKTILGAAVIDDVLALLVLSMVQGLQSSAAPSVSAIAFMVLQALVFISGGIALGIHLLRNLVEREDDSKPEKTFLLSLSMVFFYSYVAEFIGLSAIVGAFVAGIVLAQGKFAAKLAELVHPLEVIFTPMFFLSLGMLIDVRTILPSLAAILAISAIAILTKVIGCGVAAMAVGSKMREALIVGTGMVPRGEIALIIALLGLEGGVLTASQYSIISGMAFATTVIPPLLLKPLISGQNQAYSGK